jgi:adenylate cyclase
MASHVQYTTLAHRYTARFPTLTYVGTQVNFWILANILLATITYLNANIVSQTFETPLAGSFGTLLLVAFVLGILYGVGLGVTGYHLDRKFFKRLSLGKVLLFKAIITIALLAIVLTLLRFVLFERFISPSLNITGFTLNDKAWDSLFYLLLIYYFFMSLMIGFINQVNRKYGPGVLVPLLLGRYREPKEEERIFMFMDLKSSTSIAERLGHLTYSSFIRDCFADINEVLYPFYAQVYQYVGDEIVVMWPMSEGLNDRACIRFYFAVRKQFQNRSEHYETTYGLLPIFKAGLHMGNVTAVEIGEIKKDIAYHGDVLNTTARIQSVCNEYNSDFLASEYLIEKVGVDDGIKCEHLGLVLLKGKTEKIGLVKLA